MQRDEVVKNPAQSVCGFLWAYTAIRSRSALTPGTTSGVTAHAGDDEPYAGEQREARDPRLDRVVFLCRHHHAAHVEDLAVRDEAPAEEEECCD
jgi:hypothetical protein